jgi:hypothetical protein
MGFGAGLGGGCIRRSGLGLGAAPYQRQRDGLQIPFPCVPGLAAELGGRGDLPGEPPDLGERVAVLRALDAREVDEPAPAPKPRAPRGTFDRNAYQREYMRRKRAAQKPQ